MKKFILSLLCTGALVAGCNSGTKRINDFEGCVNELTGKQVHLFVPLNPSNLVFRVDRERAYAVNTTNGTIAEWLGHGSLPLDTLTPQETELVNAVSNCSTKLFPQP